MRYALLSFCLVALALVGVAISAGAAPNPAAAKSCNDYCGDCAATCCATGEECCTGGKLCCPAEDCCCKAHEECCDDAARPTGMTAVVPPVKACCAKATN